jgi:hypothetical protein
VTFELYAEYQRMDKVQKCLIILYRKMTKEAERKSRDLTRAEVRQAAQAQYSFLLQAESISGP